MEIMEKLFGSAAKVKILRLFLLNRTEAFDSASISERAKVRSPAVRSIVSSLEKIGFIKRRSYFKEIKKGRDVKKRRCIGWALDEQFPYLRELHALLVSIPPFGDREILRKLGAAGKIRAVVVAGIFLQEPDSRLDLLIVGDNIRTGTLDRSVKTLEAHIGKELRYAAFETPQFQYRVKVYDRLVRDVLDYPHKIVVDKIGLR